MFIVCLSKKTTGWHLASESETKQCLDSQRQRWGCAAATRGSERIPPRPVKKRHSAPGPAALVDSFWNSLEGSDGFNLSTPALHCNLAGERVVCGPLLFGGSGYRWNLF